MFVGKFFGLESTAGRRLRDAAHTVTGQRAVPDPSNTLFYPESIDKEMRS